MKAAHLYIIVSCFTSPSGSRTKHVLALFRPKTTAGRIAHRTCANGRDRAPDVLLRRTRIDKRDAPARDRSARFRRTRESPDRRGNIGRRRGKVPDENFNRPCATQGGRSQRKDVLRVHGYQHYDHQNVKRWGLARNLRHLSSASDRAAEPCRNR